MRMANEPAELNIAAIIGKVAERHGVLLDSKDPIMTVVTVCEVALQHFVVEIDARLQHFSNEQTINGQRQVEASKEVAEKVITGAAAYLNKQMKVTTDQAMERIMANLDVRLAAAEASRRVAMGAAAVSLVALVLSAGLALASWVH
jgi:N-acyl-L-homoserine lactone synthetase